MQRLFVGIRLPQPLQEELAVRQGGLEGARWSAPENFHITLFFVGDVPGHHAKDLALALSEIRQEPFSVELGGEDFFGKSNPHALYTSVKPSEPLERLAAKVRETARGFAEDQTTRKFKPHVTLAYLRGVRQEALRAYLSALPLRRPLDMPVTEFELIESHLREDGALYQTLASYTLGR